MRGTYIVYEKKNELVNDAVTYVPTNPTAIEILTFTVDNIISRNLNLNPLPNQPKFFKVQAIKELREECKIGLMNSKDIIEHRYAQRYGV